MDIVSEFYIESQIKKLKETWMILKNQKDSIKQVLDLNLSNVAIINDKYINANISYKQKVNLPSQKSQIEVQASQAIYLQLIQNLNSDEVLVKLNTLLSERVMFYDQADLIVEALNLSPIRLKELTESIKSLSN